MNDKVWRLLRRGRVDEIAQPDATSAFVTLPGPHQPIGQIADYRCGECSNRVQDIRGCSEIKQSLDTFHWIYSYALQPTIGVSEAATVRLNAEE